MRGEPRDGTPLNFDKPKYKRMPSYFWWRNDDDISLVKDRIAHERYSSVEATLSKFRFGSVDLSSITDTSTVKPRITLEELEARWDSVKYKD